MQPLASAAVLPDPALSIAMRCAAEAMFDERTPHPVPVAGLCAEDIEIAHVGLFAFDKRYSRENQQRWLLTIPRDPDYLEPDDGVIRKCATDRKVYLHYRPDLEAHLAKQDVLLTGNERRWFSACNSIRDACVSSLVLLARAMDEVSPGFQFEERVCDAESELHHVLRVLKYDAQDGQIAVDHTDRCAITLRLSESMSGFCAYIGPNKEKMVIDFPARGFAHCFPGDQLARLTGDRPPALKHGVVNSDPAHSRWAVVFFGKMYEL